MPAIFKDVTYSAARSFYAVTTLVLIWGTLIWSPIVTLGIVLAYLHLVTRIEENRLLEKICKKLRTERRLPTGPPRFLSHVEDRQLLLFLSFLIVDYISAFYIYHNFDAWIGGGPFSKICYTLGVGTMLGWAAGVNIGVVFHNHLHRGSFRSPSVNRWIGRLWTIPSGWPSYFWQYKHTIIHHKHVGTAADWVQPRTTKDGRYENIYRYILCHWPWRYAWHLWRDLSNSGPRRRRRAVSELALFLPFWLAPVVFDPTMGLGLWLYPHWFGSAFILGTGMYTQHAGGTTDKKHSASTTFLSEFFNLTMFNVGYHTEHHSHPSVHWSELPDLHLTLRDELIREGAHVVAFGSYRAGSLLSSIRCPEAAFDEFRKQHPHYVAREPNMA